MTTLYCDPSLKLALLLGVVITACPADSGRVDQDLSPCKCHQASCLGIPLIPANQDSKPTHRGIDGAEAQITRCKVKLLVISRVIGYVHLAINPCDSAVLL